MSHNNGDMSMPTPMSPNHNNNQSTMKTDDMSMHMSFFWGKDAVVLFAGWPGSGHLGMYILALAAVFSLAVVAEILSVAPKLKPGGLNPVMGALVHASVYAVRMALAYLIMLSVMSFNLGVFAAAVAGHALGCFLVKYRALTAAARTVDLHP